MEHYIKTFAFCFITELEMRSVERDICPVASFTMNELFL